jgi:hypothetical protein
MKLRQIFESPRKVAVAAFGRMNPPTIGHDKLVNKIKEVDGDHYLFLSQTQKPKDNPLPFDVKLEFAKKFFPGVNVGHPTVRTPIQMLQMLEKLGYTDIVYVAGSDRVEQFEKLFNDYNGKEYNFNSIQVVSAGERDPDADGAEGMSASKMRAAAASGDFDSFAQGVPTPALAQKLYDAVRTGMGIKDTVSTEAERGFRGVGGARGRENDENEKIDAMLAKQDQQRREYEQSGKFWLKTKDTQQHISDEFVGKAAANKAALELLKQKPELKGNLLITAYGPAEKQEGVAEAAYEGNIGIMELFKFFSKAEKEDPKLVARVKEMIKQRRDKEVWRIIQDYTGTQLTGKEFEGSIKEAIFREAGHGKYWCSTDKKWKYRQGPKQSRSS